MCWPEDVGGDGKNMLYQFIFVEEMEYWGMPYGNLTFTSIAPSIAAFGTEEQKREWLPLIYRGEAIFAIGYSEPNAGTDLASLRTRAERDGDEWVIHGQKIWTSWQTCRRTSGWRCGPIRMRPSTAASRSSSSPPGLPA